MADVYPTKFWIINNETDPPPSSAHGFQYSPEVVAEPNTRVTCSLTITNPSGSIVLYKVGAQAREDGGDWFPCNAGNPRCDIQWCWFVGYPGVKVDASTGAIHVWYEFFNESHTNRRIARILALTKGHTSGGSP
jgi:hypothetical protein